MAKANAATPVAVRHRPRDLEASLTFGGSPTAMMNKGAELLSDPVNLKVPDLARW